MGIRQLPSDSFQVRFQLDGAPHTGAIARVIVEQMGCTHVAAPLDDLDQIDRIKPSKTITSLKTLYPTAGELYGQLTRTTHLDLANTRPASNAATAPTASPSRSPC